MAWRNAEYPINDWSVMLDELCECCGGPSREHLNKMMKSDNFFRCVRPCEEGEDDDVPVLPKLMVDRGNGFGED